ncbi:MAG: hypothetical protein HYZ40_15685 [Rhodospirillales bacterium]|nr:hypothetical protein [Rhodospirillales bacterium]
MSGRSILIAIGLSGWLLVSIAAFMTVAYAGFFGIGVIGLLMWFICTIVDLEIDGAVGGGMSPNFLAHQVKAKVELSPAQRMARLGEKLVEAQSARFFKYLGAALALIGLAGFVVFQL